MIKVLGVSVFIYFLFLFVLGTLLLLYSAQGLSIEGFQVGSGSNSGSGSYMSETGVYVRDCTGQIAASGSGSGSKSSGSKSSSSGSATQCVSIGKDTDRLTYLQRLPIGGNLVSANSRYRLKYRADGMLILYDTSKTIVLWSSNTKGVGTSTFAPSYLINIGVIQARSLYDTVMPWSAVSSTGSGSGSGSGSRSASGSTSGSGSGTIPISNSIPSSSASNTTNYLQVTDYGDLVVYNAAGSTLWRSNTGNPPVPSNACVPTPMQYPFTQEDCYVLRNTLRINTNVINGGVDIPEVPLVAETAPNTFMPLYAYFFGSATRGVPFPITVIKRVGAVNIYAAELGQMLFMIADDAAGSVRYKNISLIKPWQGAAISWQDEFWTSNTTEKTRADAVYMLYLEGVPLQSTINPLAKPELVRTPKGRIISMYGNLIAKPTTQKRPVIAVKNVDGTNIYLCETFARTGADSSAILMVADDAVGTAKYILKTTGMSVTDWKDFYWTTGASAGTRADGNYMIDNNEAFPTASAGSGSGSGSSSLTGPIATSDVASAKAAVCNLQPYYNDNTPDNPSGLGCAAYLLANPKATSKWRVNGGAANVKSKSSLVIPVTSITASINNLSKEATTSTDLTGQIYVNDMVYFGYLLDVQGPFVVASITPSKITFTKKYIGPNLTNSLISVVSSRPYSSESDPASSTSPVTELGSSTPITGSIYAGTSYITTTNTVLPDTLDIGDLIYIEGDCNQYDTDLGDGTCRAYDCNAGEVDTLKNNECKQYNCRDSTHVRNAASICTVPAEYAPCPQTYETPSRDYSGSSGDTMVVHTDGNVCTYKTVIATTRTQQLVGVLGASGHWDDVPTGAVSGGHWRPKTNPDSGSDYGNANANIYYSIKQALKAASFTYDVIAGGVPGNLVTKTTSNPSYIYRKTIGPFIVSSTPSINNILIRSYSSGDLDANGKFMPISSQIGVNPLFTSLQNANIQLTAENAALATATSTAATSAAEATEAQNLLSNTSPGSLNYMSVFMSSQNAIAKSINDNITLQVAQARVIEAASDVSFYSGAVSPDFLKNKVPALMGRKNIKIYKKIYDSTVTPPSGSGSSGSMISLNKKILGCPVGTAGPSCTPCAAGQTSTGNGAACTGCDAGYYCPGGVAPTTCPAGYYCPSSTAAVACPPGKSSTGGSTATSATACTDCPTGYYCPGGISAIACPIGTTSRDGTTAVSEAECINCPPGFYCPGGRSVESPPGKTSTGGITAITEAAFIDCPAGYYCPGGPSVGCTPGKTSTGGITATSQAACTNCPIGYYCPGSAAAVACAAGQTSTGGVTAVSNAACTNCPSGQSSVAGGVCTNCAVGYYCPGGTAAVACPAGQTSTGGMTAISDAACTNCPSGESSVEGGACRPCSVGYACPGAVAQIPCPAGYYCPGGKSVPLSVCPSGAIDRGTSCDINTPVCLSPYELVYSGGDRCRYRQSWSSFSDFPVQRPQGYYQLVDTVKIPLYCPPNKYCPGGNPAAAVDCPAGKSSPGGTTSTSIDACVTCPAGKTYSETEGCVNCPAGKSSVEGGLCIPCPRGESSLEASTTCATCPAGYYCLGGVDKEPCPTGYSCPGGAATPLSVCPTGYTDTGTQCIPPGGTYGAYKNVLYCDPGQTHTISGGCTACPAGSYCPGGTYPSGQNRVYCPAGKISTGGSTAVSEAACSICDAGTYSFAGADYCNTCDAGTYSLPGAGSCSPCPTGYSCPGGTEVPATTCPSDYTTQSLTCTKLTPVCSWGQTLENGYCVVYMTNQPKLVYYPSYTTDSIARTPLYCPPNKYCPGGNPAAAVDCPAGKTSLGGPTSTSIEACVTCPPGKTYSENGLCINCPAGFYCPGGASVPCPAGKTSTGGIAATSQAACTNCPIGYYCPGSGAVVPCNAGYYCPGGASVACAAGKTSAGGVTAITEAACTSCPPGSYCPGGASVPCAAGKTSAGGVTAITEAACTNCNAGQSSVAGGECRNCDAGYYCPGGVAVACAAGKTSTGGLTATSEAACNQCNPGFYCPGGTPQARCRCDPGNYCPAGSSEATPGTACPLGYYCGGGSQDKDLCFPPPGNYCPVQSTTSSGTTCLAGDVCPGGWTPPYRYVCPINGIVSGSTCTIINSSCGRAGAILTSGLDVSYLPYVATDRVGRTCVYRIATRGGGYNVYDLPISTETTEAATTENLYTIP